MRPLSVLFTNNALGQRGGSETYVRDVALALLRRGHRPVVFSLVLGEIAAELRAATVPVLDDLTRLGEPPDVIHGHHHLETLIGALAFPGIPIVNFCHGWVPWEEMPLHHPAVRRYVAVDEVCVDRLVREEGIAPERVELLLNFVDLDRFRPRPTLPPRPARAVVLSNGATTRGYASVIAAACEAAGISLDIVGGAAGNAAARPEALLPGYDLVFAKGRTALEALAVGCATVLADVAGAGPLVTPDNYPSLRARNFGIRELRRGHDPDWYATQIARYNAGSMAEVSARVRAEAGMEPAIDRLLDIYALAISAPPGAGDGSRAAAVHVSRIARAFKEASHLGPRLEAAAQDLAVARAEAESFATQVSRLEDRLGLTDHELTLAHGEAADLRGQLAAFRSLPTLKLRDAVLRTPVIGSLLQSSARGVVKLLRR
jgi:glycosyltransferase involved in cell wall biosynthesis